MRDSSSRWRNIGGNVTRPGRRVATATNKRVKVSFSSIGLGTRRIRTTHRRSFRSTMRPTSSRAPSRPRRATKVTSQTSPTNRTKQVSSRTRANRTSTYPILTRLWTAPPRRTDLADACSGLAKLAKRKPSPSIEGKRPLCGKEGA